MTYKEHFIKCWPNEGVGYLKNGEFFPLENIAADPLHQFEVDPSFLLEEPDCLLHSHCTGNEKLAFDARSPSEADLQGQIATAIEWGICVTDGETCTDPLTWGNPNNRPPLIGRDFIHNIQDCFALMQDWFYLELGVVIENIPRTPGWNHNGESLIEDNFEKLGFVKVPVTDIERGDVLLYQVHSQVANHIGTYIGDGQVISHWYGRQSCVEPYTKWARFVKFAVRYTK